MADDIVDVTWVTLVNEESTELSQLSDVTDEVSVCCIFNDSEQPCLCSSASNKLITHSLVTLLYVTALC